MGKRELFIVLGFVAAGVLVYQLTAPAAPEGEEGFSFSRLIRGVRSEVNPASATVTHEGTLEATSALREVRLAGSVRQLRIEGEDRANIAYSLVVNSTGPDEATAGAYATRTVLRSDDVGETMNLRVDYPPEASQTTALTLRLPRRLAARISGRMSPVIAGVAAVALEDVVGDVTLEHVSGEVTGTHRSGRVTLEGARSVDLGLTNSRLTATKVGAGVALTAQGGEVTVRESGGAAALTLRNVEARVTAHDGAVRVTGSGGELVLDAPGGEVRVDAQRMDVEIVIRDAVAMTVFTTDETLRLIVAASAHFALDAAADAGGEIESAFELTPTTEGATARLTHAFGAASPRVVLRNTRGDIVLRERK